MMGTYVGVPVGLDATIRQKYKSNNVKQIMMYTNNCAYFIFISQSYEMHVSIISYSSTNLPIVDVHGDSGEFNEIRVRPKNFRG